MNKVEPSRKKFSLITVLSLGFIVLGIGFIFWAIYSLCTQSNYSADAISSRLAASSSSAAGLNRKTDGNTATMELNHSIIPLASNKTLYPEYPSEGDKIGSLTIPALKRVLPIIQGTDVNDLKKGVGHFIQSVLPGEEDNCVFSGHRETVFRQLGKLMIGDLLIVKTSAGTFTYAVNGTRIVHADDKTVIVPIDHAVLTMTTCYPFNTPGYFPDRYIVCANLVKSK